MDYELIDSGDGQKLERFGNVILARPCAQAVWRPRLPAWEPHARFTRDKGNHWELYKKVPDAWIVSIKGVRFQLKRTDFGHLGVFPEHAAFWHGPFGKSVLNLFAYSGGASLAAAKSGASVTHVDAAKGMVSWARENAELNQVKNIRWIVEDARKYLARAVRREEQFDTILLDPPTFGRGKSNEIFKIERDLPLMLDHCFQLNPKTVILSCHTPGFTPIVLKHLLPKGTIECGELLLGDFVPSGAYARWTR